MTDYKKQGLIVITLILFAVFQALMVIAHFLGADLTINFNFELSRIEQDIIGFIIYMANLYFFIRISTKTDKALFKCLFFIPIYILMRFVAPYDLVFNIFTIFFILSIYFTTRNIKFSKFITRLLLLYMLSFIWQFIVIIIKTNIVYLGTTDLILNIIISIDYIIILYLIAKGGSTNGLVQLDIITKRRKFRMGEKTCKQSEVELTEKQGKVYWLLVMGTQVLQVFLLVYIGYRFGAILELLTILISFWIYRAWLGVSWHANTLISCTALSVVFFVCLSIKTVPLEASITITLLSALGLAVALHMYELKCNQVERKNKAIIKMADMITPEKVIRYKVRSKELKKTHADAIIKREIEGKTVKEVAFEMGYSEDSIKRFCREYKR